MKSGTGPTRKKHLDFDYVKSHHPQLYAGIAPLPTFPENYNVDAYFGPIPDQNALGEPYGCTNFTTADLATDLTNLPHNYLSMEAVTRANALGGFQIRDSLDAARKILMWIKGYFNIRSSGIIDSFDACRLAIISGSPERRAVSVGTPWHFQFDGVGADGIIQMPTRSAVGSSNFWDSASISWHNHSLCGWKTINGEPYLISKSWQGTAFADGGYCYFSRRLFNTMMAIKGSAAFTATNNMPDTIETVDMTIIGYIVSYVRHLLGL